MGIAADGFPELGADEYKSILLVVTLLVEGSCTEGVIRCPEEKFYLFNFPGLVKDGAENFGMSLAQAEDLGVENN